MNPARTFAAAFSGNIWTAIWIYFTAPLIGMLLAAEAYLRHAGVHKIFCAKLHHHNDKHLGTIIAPPHIHNMAWGDEDGKTLYLCARHGLYKIRLNIAGVRPREMTKQ